MAHSSGGELPLCRHVRVNLGDPSLVKHTLDEQAAMYLLDQGYTEDVTLSNLKLGLGLFAVLLTLFAQFNPWAPPFPEGAAMLKGCVLLFFAIQGVLQLLHLLVEKDCILLTKGRSEGEQAAAAAAESSSSSGNGSAKKTALQLHQQKLLEQQAAKLKKKGGAAAAPAPSPSSSASSSSLVPAELCVADLPSFAVSLQASLARYATDYQLTLATRTSESLCASLMGSSSSSASPKSTVSPSGIPLVAVSVSLQITDYFDTEGVFLLERYQKSMQELLQAFKDEVQRVQAGEAAQDGPDSQPTKEGKKKQ